MRARLISLGILAILVGAIGWYVVTNWQEFTELVITQPLWIVPALLLSVASIYTVGKTMELAIEPYGVKLKTGEMFGLASINRFSNNVAPGYVGLAVRAAYLKKTYKVSIAKTSASFVISNVVQFFVSGLLAIAAYVLYVGFSVSDTPAPLLLVIGVLAAFLLMLFAPLGIFQTLLSKIRTSHDNKVLERLSVVLDSYIQVRSHPGMMQRIAFWTTATTTIAVLSTLALYFMIGFKIGLVEAIFITSLASWGIIFAFTPANIGIREGLMVFGAQVVNVPIPETLAMAVLLRLVTTVPSAILAFYYTPKLMGTSLMQIFRFKKSEADTSL